jgi:hypothetical protein
MRHHPHFAISKRYQLRARVQYINVFTIKGRNPFVKIQSEFVIDPAAQSRFCSEILGGVETEIDVARWSEAGFRVQSSRRPSFN